jgi:hypothetical protein
MVIRRIARVAPGDQFRLQKLDPVKIFSEYLGSLGLPFDYEPPLGQRRPDFRVYARSGDVLRQQPLSHNKAIHHGKRE